MKFLGILLFLSLFSIVSADEKLDLHGLPRPLILEYPEIELTSLDEAEVSLRCTSWRVAVEANNLNPWKTIPCECADYVKDYMMKNGYSIDLQMVYNEASEFARNVELSGDGKDVWVFDVDETLISNLPYYTAHGYGLEVFDHKEFDKWVEKGLAPVIESSLKLYQEVQGLGFKVFLLTGRKEEHRGVTIENLKTAGFQKWDSLLLRSSEDHVKTATIYKSEKRSEIVNQGYRILGNSGDQWSDLLGAAVSLRSFKLPNPMYYIP
ncbi:hypothetical protein MKX01_020243 [Papaver californicum]|nr:hypothetical protein MKX01_020243 [Papaver californicum]